MNGGFIDDVRKTSNGAEVAKRIPREQAKFRVRSKNVAAIDFGTTNCSIAYLTEADTTEQEPHRLLLNGTYERVPTAILFKEDGAFVSFGNEARHDYLDLDDDARPNYLYFEQIKMELQQDENVSREQKVNALNGKEFHLVEVIAHILKYLKNQLLEHLKRADHPLEVTDFDWVITVPAIWKARGKQMMREAGYKAGLCSVEMTGNKLMEPSSASRVQSLPETSPDKLSLALEPESAAIYCHISSKKQTNTVSDTACYLVVDIGGGTVDISAYRIATIGNRQHIEMVQPPSGNESGGSKVNQNFRKFLEVLVKDTGFSRYINGPDEKQNAKHRAHLHQITNQIFELQKVLYGNKSRSERGRVAVRLTHSFATFYAQELQTGASQDPDIQIVEQTLRLTKAKMEGFFEPLIKSICEAISESIQDLQGKIHGIYLVGGFGGSNYIYTVIDEEFGRTYKCIRPHDPHFAVINGAVLFGLNPNTVFARRADASYGVRSATPFITGLHEDQYKRKDDDGVPYCKNVFVTYVERGDSVCTGEVFYHSFYPFWHSQRSLQIEIYSSPEKDVWYTTGKWGKGREAERPANVYKLGELTVEMPVLRGDKNRPVDVQLDFSQTEIQVRAYDRTSKNEVKVVVDFLSCVEDPNTPQMTDVK